MNVVNSKSFFGRRRVRKQVEHLLRAARHVLDLRGDIASPADARRLVELMASLSAQFRAENYPALETISDQLAGLMRKINPGRPYSVLRENIEVIVVALAVAMAFRTYIIQPFKIPTSSMYPTLAGIRYLESDRKTFFDNIPFKFVKWAVFGQTYFEVKSQASGAATISQTKDGIVINVAGIDHKLYPNMRLRVGQNDTVLRGQVLASGMKVAGDHIFVNKVKWNFMPPERGEIMVFKTDGIKYAHIIQNEHYVKRMVGLPGETLGIATPDLYINGKVVRGIPKMDEIQACRDGYNGYIQTGDFMTVGVSAVKLGKDQYFACGDNQRNSMDSRYWGPVPSRNLVGPAFFVYWPMSSNWGLAR